VLVAKKKYTRGFIEDEAGLSLSKLVSKLEAGSPRLEFPGRASIRVSTTLNEKGLDKRVESAVCQFDTGAELAKVTALLSF
jgi:hypothetical protein